jgi:V/A-type H+/Na+-transporting ATPase subunit E
MALEDILESLETEAQKQSQEILDRANSQAAKLVAEAKEDAAQTLAAAEQAGAENARSQTAKLLLEARFKAKKIIAGAKEELIDEAFANAERLIGSARDGDAYPDILTHLAREAVEQDHGGAGLTLQVNPADETVIQQWLEARPGNSITVQGSADIKSGVAMAVDGGGKTGINTLESRFEKAKRMLRTRVGVILFDGG